MAIVDAAATITGAAIVNGSLAVLSSISETLAGSSAAGGPPVLTHEFIQTLAGSGTFSGNSQGVFNVSGFLTGGGQLIDATVQDASALLTGSAVVSAEALRIINSSAYFIGGSFFALSIPDPIIGVGILTGYMEVTRVPPPICQTPPINTTFRWGQVFTKGGLEICVVDGSGNPIGPVCITYTLYQLQRGCAPKQVGPSGRKPVSPSVGCYYVTGTAGECGQPGLWLVRWRYQRTFGDPMVERDCYFQVLDSVLCPVPGDTLPRTCKYGWD